MGLPVINTSYTFYISLIDDLDPSLFKVDPTIAAGDFKVSKDGGSFVNLTNLPVVSPTGGIPVKIILTADEMNASEINVQGIDSAVIEWQEVLITMDTHSDAAGDSIWRASLTDNNTVGTFGYLMQTSIIGYLISILNRLTNLTISGFSSKKRTQSKQK
jgi:hypothetical protein